MEPISPTIQDSFRTTLGISSAPAFYAQGDLDHILPVAVVAQTAVASAAQFVKPTDGTNNASITPAGEFKVDLTTNASLATWQPAAASTIKTTGANSGGISAGNDYTLYTVTASKKFYMTGFILTYNAAAVAELHLNDGTGDTTVKYVFVVPAGNYTNAPLQLNFTAPISFATAVVLRAVNALAGSAMSCNGYEQ